jgi:hypothetical protein
MEDSVDEALRELGRSYKLSEAKLEELIVSWRL